MSSMSFGISPDMRDSRFSILPPHRSSIAFFLFSDKGSMSTDTRYGFALDPCTRAVTCPFSICRSSTAPLRM